ncbi:unnamed protein product [Adineta ricciae]|uniref:ABC transporter domain-containing protein n=1 Tax=Adineta ricciae TaxID=249248 RepID=A0A815N0P3_ADIRI|nr:unnamed protein product [Adineta ricciae]
MQQSITQIVIILTLIFVCSYGQLSIVSRFRDRYRSFKNVKLVSTNTNNICVNCVNSTCNLPRGYCFIDNLCLQDGDARYMCLECNSSQNQFEWSYNPSCSVGNAYCSNPQFIAQHICNSSVINAFYEDFHNATVNLYNPKCSSLFCEPGFFYSTSVNNSNSISPTNMYSCCPGYFCPDGQICMIPCRDAAYCPSPLIPNNGFCLTNVDCPQNAPSQFNAFGCGGSSVEGFCQSGSYCPNSSTEISCQNLDSVYCPSGVTSPIDCPTGFTCQNGILDSDQIFNTAMAVVLVPFGILIGIRLIVNIGILQFVVKRYEHFTCCSLENSKRRKKTYVVNKKKTSDYFKKSTESFERKYNGFNIELENGRLDIPKWTKDNKGFTFCIESGQINGIMGQSGCGKTSLLYAIQGRKSLQKESTIIYNDTNTKNGHWHPLHTCLSDIVGYVPQEDVMHSDLTVFETVYFSACSRRLKDDRETIRNDVDFVLEKLSMTNQANTTTEKLSGGERKRVNIAMEIVACPKILLLDEPTSGLDTVICDKVFDLLNIIKQNQLCSVNIILIIHQPNYELFQQIDHLILLNPDCYLAYSGQRQHALTHLRHHVHFHEDSDEYQQIYKSMNECDCCIYALAHYPKEHAIENPLNITLKCQNPSIFNFKPTNRQSILMPIIYIIHRTCVQMFRRNYAIEAIYALAFFLLGLIIGRLFREKAQSCDIKSLPAIYFMISLGFGMATCISSQRLFGIEMVDKTFVRETRNSYHPIQYWLAKSFVDLIHLFLYPLLFLTMLYIEIIPRSTFLEYYSVLISMSFACSAIGQFVSVACQKTENSYLAATLIALISCLISGFNPTKSQSLHSLVYLSFSRHVQRQLFLFDTNKFVQNASTISLWNTQIDALTVTYSFEDNERSIGCLMAIGILMRLLTIVFLYGRSEYRSKFRFYLSKLFDFIGYQPR